MPSQTLGSPGQRQCPAWQWRSRVSGREGPGKAACRGWILRPSARTSTKSLGPLNLLPGLQPERPHSGAISGAAASSVCLSICSLPCRSTQEGLPKRACARSTTTLNDSPNRGCRQRALGEDILLPTWDFTSRQLQAHGGQAVLQTQTQRAEVRADPH